jgi:hypothetical protein
MDEQYDDNVIFHLRAARRYPHLPQLICAALADPSFAARLITDPVAALWNAPPDIQLSAGEYHLVTSITGATDIYDFAWKIHIKVCNSER